MANGPTGLSHPINQHSESRTHWGAGAGVRTHWGAGAGCWGAGSAARGAGIFGGGGRADGPDGPAMMASQNL